DELRPARDGPDAARPRVRPAVRPGPAATVAARRARRSPAVRISGAADRAAQASEEPAGDLAHDRRDRARVADRRARPGLGRPPGRASPGGTVRPTGPVGV